MSTVYAAALAAARAEVEKKREECRRAQEVLAAAEKELAALERLVQTPPAAAGGGGGGAKKAPAKKAPKPRPCDGSLCFIQGETYMVCGRNVFAFDDIEEKVGAYVGRLSEDEESIIPDAEEE